MESPVILTRELKSKGTDMILAFMQFIAKL